MTNLCRSMVARLALLGALASCLTGCHIISDGIQRDGQSAANIPQAIGQGTQADLKNYEKLKNTDPEAQKKKE